MNARSIFLIGAATALAVLTIGFAALVRLPAGATLPIHWNVAGVVDDRENAQIAIWIMPIFILMISALIAMLPKLSPRTHGLVQSGSLLRTTYSSVLSLLTLAQIMIVAPAFGWQLSTMILQLGIGFLLVAIGNVFPKSRPNFFIGIRTPWTLASTDNWIAVHRLAGRTFVLAGVIVATAALLPLSPEANVSLILAPACLAGFVPAAYSWWLWRNNPPSSS